MLDNSKITDFYNRYKKALELVEETHRLEFNRLVSEELPDNSDYYCGNGVAFITLKESDCVALPQMGELPIFDAYEEQIDEIARIRETPKLLDSLLKIEELSLGLEEWGIGSAIETPYHINKNNGEITPKT